MANKGFGVKEITLNGTGTPTIQSPNDLNLVADKVAIGTDATIGRNLSVVGLSTFSGTVTVSGIITAGRVGGNIDGPIWIDESEDDNVYYNIPWLDTTEGGNGYRRLQVDSGNQIAFNPSLNSLQVSGFVTAFSGYNIGIQSNGTYLTYGPTKVFNFVGAGITVTNSGTLVTVNVAGGSGEPGVGTNTSINTSGIITAAAFDSSITSGTPYISVGVGQTELSIEANHVAISTDLTVSRNLNVVGTTTSLVGKFGYVTSEIFETVSTLGNGQDIGYIIRYNVTANGTTGYRFSGPGLVSTTDNPTLYLHRGFSYLFENQTGTDHPFAIRYSDGGVAYGSTYLLGIQTGTQVLTVPFDAPASLVYQCTIHPGMIGTLNILS